MKSRNDAQLRNALGVSDPTLKTVKSAEDTYGGDETIKTWADKFNRCEPMILPAGVPDYMQVWNERYEWETLQNFVALWLNRWLLLQRCVQEQHHRGNMEGNGNIVAE